MRLITQLHRVAPDSGLHPHPDLNLYGEKIHAKVMDGHRCILELRGFWPMHHRDRQRVEVFNSAFDALQIGDRVMVTYHKFIVDDKENTEDASDQDRDLVHTDALRELLRS